MKKKWLIFLKNEITQIEDLSDLSDSITALAHKVSRKMVLLIDEVDSSSSQALFLDFLGMLRHKYLNRERKTERTFHSVILTGVHDIKTLKLKMRPEMTIAPYNSPWNIAADFEVEMSFRVEELLPMLEAYQKDRNVVIDVETIATALIYYTAGYPFLVSSLCKIFDERILPQKKEKTWTVTDLEKAVKRLISKTNTNFDHLKKSLKNNKNLYRLTYNIAINGQKVTFNVHNETIELGLMYGVFKRNKDNIGNLQIHNLVYQSVISDFMVGQLENEVDINRNNLTDSYQLPNDQLDMEAVLQKFQLAMKEYYSKKDRDFLEKHGRLIFLSFLKPIINGSGFAFAEPQFSDEKRLDIAITFYQYKYIVELKIWRGLIAHKKGLEQLADYLELHNQKEGFLLIYDHRKKKSWNKKWVTVKKKRIYAVWL